MDYSPNTNFAKTFNTGKKYAEEILFPKMDLFQKYQRQAEFGSENLDLAMLLDKEMREIQRFNGLKAMNDILYGLLLNITSTVRVNNGKNQIDELEKMKKISHRLKILFDNGKEKFFDKLYDEGRLISFLDKNYFYKIKDLVEKMYVNCEILMTKNKLLFAENREEYMNDKDILNNIKNEYIDE